MSIDEQQIQKTIQVLTDAIEYLNKNELNECRAAIIYARTSLEKP